MAEESYVFVPQVKSIMKSNIADTTNLIISLTTVITMATMEGSKVMEDMAQVFW